MRDVVLSSAVMLKYPCVCFEDNVLTFSDKISGKTNCPALGASESTRSAETLQEDLDALVILEPDPDIRDVNEQHHLSKPSTRLSTPELPHYLTCREVASQ